MKTWYRFIVAAFAAAFLTGCGSSSSPSKDQVEKAVRIYVGMARPDMGNVKLDDFKMLNEYKQKMDDVDVFFRQFEVHYTVAYQNHLSKHSFAGTIAMAKQGQKWVTKRDACTLTFADSPPIAETIKEANTNRQEEPGRPKR